jgi:hypothetical protein
VGAAFDGGGKGSADVDEEVLKATGHQAGLGNGREYQSCRESRSTVDR